jgi:hypothetical protein
MPADHDLQQSLFAEEELAPKRYVPNPQHVRNSLKSLLEEMRAAKRWPWEGAVLELYRDIVPPQLYAETARCGRSHSLAQRNRSRSRAPRCRCGIANPKCLTDYPRRIETRPRSFQKQGDGCSNCTGSGALRPVGEERGVRFVKTATSRDVVAASHATTTPPCW